MSPFGDGHRMGALYFDKGKKEKGRHPKGMAAFLSDFRTWPSRCE